MQLSQLYLSPRRALAARRRSAASHEGLSQLYLAFTPSTCGLRRGGHFRSLSPTFGAKVLSQH
eukprot:7295027-Prymnesium_polylepis.1